MLLLRPLIFLLALVGLSWLIRRLVQPATPARRPAGGQQPPTAAESMVRDRICNTFLPKSRALTLRQGTEEHYFCSERCREAFLAGAPRSQSGA